MHLEMDYFYNVVGIMAKASKDGHCNVIKLVGCIPELPYPAIIMEYAPLGSLHDFLLKHKNDVRACIGHTAYCHASLTYNYTPRDAAFPYSPWHCGHALCQSCCARVPELLQHADPGASGCFEIWMPDCLRDGELAQTPTQAWNALSQISSTSR